MRRKLSLLLWGLTTFSYTIPLGARQWQTLLFLGMLIATPQVSIWILVSHSSHNGAVLKVMMVLDFGT